MPDPWDKRLQTVPTTAPRTRTVQGPSILSPKEIVELGGMTAESLPGIFEGEGTWLERFRPNPAFVEFLQGVISTEGPSDPNIQATARRQGQGWVYISDARRPAGNHIPPEDIFGGFKVQQGQVVPASYVRCEKYQVYTSNGLTQLPPFLRMLWIRELRLLAERRRGTTDARYMN